jgi:DNA-binding GntR family transcriptional regulator
MILNQPIAFTLLVQYNMDTDSILVVYNQEWGPLHVAKTEQVTAKERAYNYVKDGIVNMRFGEGDFITESEIAQALGVSRTPVREALLMLESEALVRHVPQKGAFIPPITIRELEEVMETRSLIELFAVDRLIARGDGGHAASLKEALGEQIALLAAGNLQDFIALDRHFHTQLVNACGNSLLIRLYQSLRDRQMRMGIRAVTDSPQRAEQVIREHQAIAAAAEQGDGELLKKLVKEHLDKTLATLKTSMLG